MNNMNNTFEFSSEVVGQVTNKVFEAIEKIDVVSMVKEIFKEGGYKMSDLYLEDARELIYLGLCDATSEIDFVGINENICETLETMTE